MIRPARARRALTILQLAVMLALLTLVACIAITAFFSRPEITLQNACVLLRDDLLSARQAAVLRHSPVTMRFLEAGNGYEVSVEVEGEPELLPSPAGGGPSVRHYDRDGGFEGVRIERVTLRAEGAASSSGLRRIVFDGNGRSDALGTIVLSFAGTEQDVRLAEAMGDVMLGDRR